MLSARSVAIAVIATCAAIVLVPAAPAQSIDLSLNVFYSTPSNPASGGTWELVAKSSNFGIAGIEARLTNVAAASNRAPRAVVNGNDAAGFSVFVDAVFPSYRDIIIGQAPLSPLGPGEEQNIFYGVGTLANGAPNYPGKPAGSNSIGPAFTSLTAPTEIPWAFNVPMNTIDWANAARLVSGTFAAGVTPDFVAGSSGQVFTTLPANNTTFGAITTAAVSTIVRTNFANVAGDYNHNGVVDAADYVVWRNTNNTSVPAGTGADGDANGNVNQADYDFWRARFGNISGSGSGTGNLSSGAVPEPATAAFVVLALAVCTFNHRTRKSSQ